MPIFDYTPLIFASREGHIEIVRLLLSQPGIEINRKSIWIHKSFIIFKFYLFILFEFTIIYGIELHYLILLLWLSLQKMVMLKLFNSYYHNQVLKSTAKTFEYKNHSQYYNSINSFNLNFKSFMGLNYIIWFYSFDCRCRKWPYWNCSTFAITIRYWTQLQNHLNTKIVHNIEMSLFNDILILNHLWDFILLSKFIKQHLTGLN